MTFNSEDAFCFVKFLQYDNNNRGKFPVNYPLTIITASD